MMTGITTLQVGEVVNQFLLIKQASAGITTVGKPFMSLVLQDKSGDIEAKLWDTKEEQQEMYRAGVIVHVGGEIQDYRGRKQLRVKAIRVAKEDEGITIGDLVPSAAQPKEELYEQVVRYLFDIKNPNIMRITRLLLEKHKDAFLIYPAAMRNHHDYASGLIDHVVSMLNLGKAMGELYPTLNTDLLYAGIILHDVGKVNWQTQTIGH